MSELLPKVKARDMERATATSLPRPPLPPAPKWAACTKKCLDPLKLLDFCEAEKRIYAKLTPHTPKNQAHNRVMKSRCLPNGEHRDFSLEFYYKQISLLPFVFPNIKGNWELQILVFSCWIHYTKINMFLWI